MSDSEIKNTIIFMLVVAVTGLIFVLGLVGYSIYRDNDTQKRLNNVSTIAQFANPA